MRTNTSYLHLCPGDGKLSKLELRAAIERVTGLSTFAGQDALLDLVLEAAGDEDGDGHLTVEEINKATG